MILVSAQSGLAETVTISMKDRVFTPRSVVVNVGDTVRWVNDDTELHQVISGDSLYDHDLGRPMNSDLIMWNSTFSFTFAKPGSYPYMCVIHRALEDRPDAQGMVGEIAVREVP
jgi:plastocyanin